jgi:hypothetical protein
MIAFAPLEYRTRAPHTGHDGPQEDAEEIRNLNDALHLDDGHGRVPETQTLGGADNNGKDQQKDQERQQYLETECDAEPEPDRREYNGCVPHRKNLCG